MTPHLAFPQLNPGAAGQLESKVLDLVASVTSKT
jgi:hypothetical protein